MGSVMAGQCAALVDRIQPAAEIVAEIMAEAEALMRAMPARVS
jgi:NAD(P)H-dependent flavin oxidoreductase YrpB (nitropropane dioxygenase family)